MNRALVQPAPLRIVHVLRAPLGGLFRHVVELAEQQAARGHLVGLVTDSETGGANAVRRLEALRSRLALGILRTPMRRQPHPSDLLALWRIAKHVRGLRADVIHGHGAKGGLYARGPAVLAPDRAIRCYTPHGGSFNYRPGSMSHRLYMSVERVLARGTDLLLFESNYIAARFDAFVGARDVLRRTIVNGLSEPEFESIATLPQAADLLYVGELRSAKGIDTLLDALALVGKAGRRVPSLVLVGSGPDEATLVAHAAALGMQASIRFAGAMPARDAFQLGRILVVPSRAESLPYVVLEAAAARVPLVATRVGGIPEIFGPYAARLVPSDDPAALSAAIDAALQETPERLAEDAALLSAFVQTRFTLPAMADGVLVGYADARRRQMVAADRAAMMTQAS